VLQIQDPVLFGPLAQDPGGIRGKFFRDLGNQIQPWELERFILIQIFFFTYSKNLIILIL
jgi:hypothetical protein